MTTRTQTAEPIPHPLAGKRMTGAEIIIQVLVDEGVQTVFGYSGGAILPTYDAVFRYNDEHRDGNGTPPLPLHKRQALTKVPHYPRNMMPARPISPIVVI